MKKLTLPQETNDLLAWIDRQQKSLVDTLVDWANINSGSTHIAGIDRYRDKLAHAFAPLLTPSDYSAPVALPPLAQINDHGECIQTPIADGLLIRKRPELTNRVLLCGHLDTVYPENHPFQTCQFIDNNTLNGPGVADMKGGILVMLTALQAFEQHLSAKNIGWDVYLSPDEEIGSQSSASVFPQFSGHAFGLIYEPSLPGGEFVGQRKGSGNFTIVVKGKAAHAGRAFYDGRNAIAKLASLVHDLHQLNDPNQTTTLNIGTIQGGQALNVVPDLAIARFNIRVESDTAATQVLQQVDALIQRHSDSDYQIERHGKMTRPAKPMDSKQQSLFTALQQVNEHLGLSTQVIATGGCCDGNNLKALGLANIDTLGVRGGNIHSDSEYVLLDSLSERSKISTLLLLGYANQWFNLDSS